jgi:cytochrome c biogenesis protein CcdA
MAWSSSRILLGIVLALLTFFGVALLLGWLSGWIGDSLSPLAGFIAINGGVLVLALGAFWALRRYRRAQKAKGRDGEVGAT